MSEHEAEFNALVVAEAYALIKLRESATNFEWHVDHRVPLQSKLVCGLHWYHSLQVIPVVDNLRKSNREWENKW